MDPAAPQMTGFFVAFSVILTLNGRVLPTSLIVTISVLGGLGAACRTCPKLGLLVGPAVLLWFLWLRNIL